MELTIESDDIDRLEHLRLDFFLLIGKFESYLGLFYLGGFVELPALDGRIRLVDGIGIEEIPQLKLLILALRPADVDVAPLVLIRPRPHVSHHQVLLYHPLLQHVLCLDLLLRHLRVFAVHTLGE